MGTARKHALRLFSLAALGAANCLPSALANTITFAGRSWDVRDSADVRQGPGGNYFSASPDNVRVDSSGRLHLRITKDVSTGHARWRCAEVSATEPTRYGEHRFFIIGRLDRLNENVVFSPFLYKTDTKELDIEFSRWGKQDSAMNAQFVVQPGANYGHRKRFQVAMTGDYSTHSLTWLDGSATFRSLHGHYLIDPLANAIETYQYVGSDLPKESDSLKVHLNLWLRNGAPPSDGKEVEIIVMDAMLPAPAPAEPAPAPVESGEEPN